VRFAERVAQRQPVVGALLEVPAHGPVEAANLIGRQGVLDAQITLHIEVPHHFIELRSAEETSHRVSLREGIGTLPPRYRSASTGVPSQIRRGRLRRSAIPAPESIPRQW